MPLCSFELRRLGSPNVPLMRQLNTLFGDAFAEPDTHTAEPPSDAYFQDLLAKEHVVALVARRGHGCSSRAPARHDTGFGGDRHGRDLSPTSSRGPPRTPLTAA